MQLGDSKELVRPVCRHHQSCARSLACDLECPRLQARPCSQGQPLTSSIRVGKSISNQGLESWKRNSRRTRVFETQGLARNDPETTLDGEGDRIINGGLKRQILIMPCKACNDETGQVFAYSLKGHKGADPQVIDHLKDYSVSEDDLTLLESLRQTGPAQRFTVRQLERGQYVLLQRRGSRGKTLLSQWSYAYAVLKDLIFTIEISASRRKPVAIGPVNSVQVRLERERKELRYRNLMQTARPRQKYT
ncbi:hypothetical protein IW262DRAFT_1399341 [Armillaria fumosa]|nr:hypothetical protein IW262DRAFT_1399341 [Armillaria fumosa]